MPEVVMSHVIPASAMCADITRHLRELRSSMDQVAEGLDGFSDTDSESEQSVDDQRYSAMATDITKKLGKGLLTSGNHLKNGLRSTSNNTTQGISSIDNERSVDADVNSHKDVTKCSENGQNVKTKECTKSGIVKKHENTNQRATANKACVQTKDTKTQTRAVSIECRQTGNTLTKDLLETSDLAELQHIKAGQDQTDVDVPIMSPPPIDESPRLRNCRSAASSRYSRPMSLHFLIGGEHVKCDYNIAKTKDANTSLLNISDKYKNNECICAQQTSIDAVFGGWEIAPKFLKSRNGKKRKFSKQQLSDVTFERLTGGSGNVDKRGAVKFQHYRNPAKYIESYRLLHTVDNAGYRTQLTSAPAFAKKPTSETDPYLSKMKSSICAMATNCDLYNLLAPPKRDSASPLSSADSANEKNRSDEESYDDDVSSDVRPYSVRDRGKMLNLAPVRECTVPEMTLMERQEQFQQNYMALNQYLNLLTPPMPSHGLQFEIDEAKMRRNGFRIVNTGESHLFPACTPRRGARPLRLGSAEFLKPGSSQNDQRWTTEKRASVSSINSQSTVPGTIIVGSTVPSSRTKSGKKHSPYVQYQKDHTPLRQYEKPQTPPNHVTGKKFKPCERVSDLTSSARDKSRFLYTHASSPQASERPAMQYRAATMMEWDSERFARRERSPLKLDVNHLGIRGHNLKSDESMALYKHRRTAPLKS